MSVKRWSHVASKDGDFRTLIILDPAEPGYCEVVGEIIKPTHAAKIASAVNDYAAVEKLLHDVIDVLRHANKCFPLTSAQIVLARYLKLYPKGRRTK